MHPLSEAPAAAEMGFNWHTAAVVGVAAVAAVIGWKIFKNLSGKQ